MDIFIENLIPQIQYPLQMQYLTSFKQIIEKRLKCEKGLVDQGILKTNKERCSTSSAKNEKSKFSSNKNVTSDGVVDAHVVNKTQLVVSLQGIVNFFVPKKSIVGQQCNVCNCKCSTI